MGIGTSKGGFMAERLTLNKIIGDLTGKNSLTTGYFNERWMQDNAIDLASARQQHQAAVTAANGPKLLGELERPEDRDDAEQLDRIEAADEFDEGQLEQWEGYFNRD
jgi:hypothetical protein